MYDRSPVAAMSLLVFRCTFQTQPTQPFFFDRLASHLGQIVDM